MQKSQQPIGVFDSGLGGLSVWQEIVKLLPAENLIYFADSANCPYGEKTVTEIEVLCKKIVDFLLSKNCKIIVVACNTATSACIETLRASYDVPFVAIEPAIKPASIHTKTKKIGVLATENTLKGNLFKKTKEKYAQNIKIITQVGYDLVEIVEQNQIDTPETYTLLEKYLYPMFAQNIDQLVLGCTHYPFLEKIILKIMDNYFLEKNIQDKNQTENQTTIQIQNPAHAVARQTKKILVENHWENHTENNKNFQANFQFFTTGNSEIMENLLKKISIEKFDIQNVI